MEAVAGYAAPDSEAAALAAGAGLYDRSHVGRLELVGADRQRFLHGLVSCDVKALAPGQGAYGFFTTAQGKVLADVTVLAFADRLWLELPAGLGATITGHLEKYLIADRVELLPLADMLPLTLLGPRAEEVLAAETAVPAELYLHQRAAVGGIEVELVRNEIAGLPAFTLWTSASVATLLLEDLRGRPGVTLVGGEAVERARVLAGVPAFGREFGAEHFPQETGCEELAVSYTKGCYLGQEVIARIHYRGKANHLMRRLWLDAATAAAEGAALLLDGQAVGRLGPVVRLADGRCTALAVVHRRAGEPGARLAVEGGGEAELAELGPVG